MPDNPNKHGNEKIRNKEGNNQEYGPINHPITNCEIKIKRTVGLPENNTEQTNEKTTFKANDNELVEQTNCQPKTEVDHANISAKPIIIHNYIHNEYPKHNRERHKDINLTEKPTESNPCKHRNSFLGHDRTSTNIDILAKPLADPAINYQLN
jgi:hypothetical protein